MRLTESIRWVWQASRGYRWRIVLRGGLGVCHVGVSLLSIGVCKSLIDVATHHVEGEIAGWVMLMIGCLVARLGLSLVGSRLSSRMEIRFRNALCHRLFGQWMEGRWTGRDTLHTGDLVNRLTEDVFTVTDTLCRDLPMVMTTGARLVGAFYFLLQLDGRLAGILGCIMPVALLLSKRYLRTMRTLSHDIRSTDSRVQSRLQEYLQHRTVVRTLEYTPRAMDALATLQGTLQRQVMRRTDYSLFSRGMVQLGFSAGYAVAFLWGIRGLYEGSISFGMMAAFLQLVAQIQQPMVDLSQQVGTFIGLTTSAERLAALTALPLETQGVSVRLNGAVGVRLEEVSFTYPGGMRQVLQGFTHDFRPGSLTAIVGETGAGKSTLLRLMLALLTPDSGRVTFYDAYRAVMASPQTRCNVSYVPQGNTLLSGTIRDNLRMGNPEATEEDLRVALHTAAADFVYTLPEGLDTLCGEQGAGLSEGQAQRIAIARGLLRPGRILLLDEPTSSLDGETEQVLLERLARNMGNRTLIVITHREALAQLCTSMVRVQRR